MERLSLIPSLSVKCHQNLEMNLVPWSEMMLSGRPCWGRTWERTKSVRPEALRQVVVGMKITHLVRHLMMTRMELYGPEFGSGSMKSMERCLHRTLGTGSG